MSKPRPALPTPAKHRRQLVEADSQMRKHLLILKKRRAWLMARVAVNDYRHLSFDQAEVAALNWALHLVELVYPDLAKVEYNG